MSGNISFENDPKIYQKITFEKDIDNALSTKKVKLTVQSDVTLQQGSGEWNTLDLTSDLISDFTGVFLAPTKVVE